MQESSTVSAASTFWLSEQKKATLSIIAEKGGNDAAFRLAQYYSFVEFDSEKERYWLERSASADRAVAQYNLSFLLFNKGEPEVGAALHWAKMARQNGEKKAQSLIDHIREAKNEGCTVLDFTPASLK